MTKAEYEIIQNKIHYTFNNKTLIDQAFTRKSYLQHNIDAMDNEVMEFYGDKILSFILAKEFAECLGQIQTGQFITPETEGSLTTRLIEFIKNSNLIQCIDKSGLSTFIKKSQNDPFTGKSKGDLFEAILGAVAIDSNWNISELTKVVDAILNPKETLKTQTISYSSNDFENILKELCSKNDFYLGNVLIYQKPVQESDTITSCSETESPETDLIRSSNEKSYFYSKLLIENKDKKKVFKQIAQSEKGARLAVSRKAYIYAKLIWLKEPVEFWIVNPISQLQSLKDAKLINNVFYNEEFDSLDKNHNTQKWNCTCTVIDRYNKTFTASDSGSSMKAAKKNAAAQLLPIICINLKKGKGLLRLIEDNYNYFINQ